MDETNGTPNLNEALAAFQAEAPQITKDQKGVIPGKDGKRGYEYSYADLAGVCAVALPLLGKHGLAFFAKPVIVGSQFGMVCKLKHASGEEEEGFYPLPSQGTPQQIGSVITYGRRYSMLMMTGLAPTEDDDAAAGNTSQQYAPQSAGAAFETAAPAPPRNGSRQEAHPAQAAKPPTEADIDTDAQEYANEVHEARTSADVKLIREKAREAHKLAAIIRNPASAGLGGFGQYAAWRIKQLEETETALASLVAAADRAGISGDALEAHVITINGKGIEDATAAHLRAAEDALRSMEPVG